MTAPPRALIARIEAMVRRVQDDESEIGVLSTGEGIAVAVVLDRRDLLPSLYPDWASAVERPGEEWHCLEASRTIGSMATKKKPGRNIPNAQRHTEQMLLRLPPEIDERIRELADEWGLTNAGVVARLVEEHDERRR